MVPSLRFWSKVPFIRLLIPFGAGIFLQWQFAFPLLVLWLIWGICLVCLLLFFSVTIQHRFKFSLFNGIIACIFISCSGSILTTNQDIRNNKNWMGHTINHNSLLWVTLEGSIEEKPNSYKSFATVRYIIQDKICNKSSGRIILYFKKQPGINLLHNGSQLIIKKLPQPIKNTGNPGSFDYKQYCLFKSITHQLYLISSDYVLLDTKYYQPIEKFIFDCRQSVLNCLKKNIHGKKELGLAEALLIGYKNDLDKNLVQAYTKTGVVHIIAISGMHLALIYGLLILLTRPIKNITFLRTTLIVAGLWLFTLMAGAQASVARSCVMFSCIALGELLGRKTSIYNTLSMSAFLLLCYQPFWLWDAGFQLSYTAVLSIVVFYRKIYGWIYLPNKMLDAIWKTMAISIAAQIFTTPVSIYNFHQFPILFLLTNLVAVPLSSLILFFEIILCVFSWLQNAANFFGWLVTILIGWMNSYIERIDKVSFALWSGFSISSFQVCLMFICIAGINNWLAEKKKISLITFLLAWLVWVCLRSNSFLKAHIQNKIIVYQIHKHSAVEIIHGRTSNLYCDSGLRKDQSARDFHIKPSRILHRIKKEDNSKIFHVAFAGYNLLILDSTYAFYQLLVKKRVDILVLTQKTKNSIHQLNNSFEIRKVIIDSSVPFWKCRQWKKECDSLLIPFYDVNEKGAFVMNL